jgi:Tol biopolymer transport system component
MIQRSRLALLAVGFLAAPLVTFASASPAGAAPAERLIVFDSDRGGQLDLWTMRPDGSGLARLTDDKVDDVFAEWSPNRKKIAWTRGGFGPDGEIWVMNADGTGRKQLTHNSFSDYDAVWSPDSSRLAFRSLRNGVRNIYVVNADGTDERQLTTDGGFAPDWSPDGSRIAFTSDRSGALAVYTMRAADGGDVRKLTDDSVNAGVARYSPDGSRILFADGFCGTCGESDLWVMNPDGSAQRQVTDTAENEIPEAWSRDGTQVVIDYAELIGNGTALAKGDIAVVTVATGATTNLTDSPNVEEAHPDWQP